MVLSFGVTLRLNERANDKKTVIKESWAALAACVAEKLSSRNESAFVLGTHVPHYTAPGGSYLAIEATVAYD